MKRYIFFYSSNRLETQPKEYAIEASGMLEALLKANRIKQELEAETLATIDLQFKGIVYS